MKKCYRCGEKKSLSEFHVQSKNKDGLQGRCKQCNIETAREWNRTHYDRRRDLQLRRKFGITTKQYDHLLYQHDGRCAICRREETIIDPRIDKVRELAVDHDHDSGENRGLLCGACNKALGMFQDDIHRLIEAARYLEFYGRPHLAGEVFLGE